MPRMTRTRLSALVACALLLVACTICAAATRIVSATATPTPVAPGQPVQLTCQLADADAVARVVGSVREIPYFTVPFAKRPDGSWAVAIPVPPESEAGTYHIDLELATADGQTVTPEAGPTTIDIVVSGAAAVEKAAEPEGVADHGAPQTFMVPMRDGVRLATDVYHGRGAAPWPVILLRSPYGRKNAKVTGLEEYAIVVQDVRGRFDSEGHALMLFDDGWGRRQDGVDTVSWMLGQPWCNGKIGTMGESYLGLTQNLLAGANPKGIICQRIEVAPGSVYQDAAYPGGVFAEALMAGWLSQKDWPEDNLRLVLAHPSYDSVWRRLDSSARIREEHVSIPAVHIGGWFDVFTQGTLDSFVTRSRIAHDQWLVMGPWPHLIKREVGELLLPENAVQLPAPATPAFWFDHWLRGVDTGLTRTPRVYYYVMGACGEEGAPGNEWRTAESWPVHATPTAFFFGPDGGLLPDPPKKSDSATYDYDPANPVPTRGGANLLIPAGPMDQRETEDRPDVQTFTTATLVQPLEVTGHITVQLWASSSARDTTFTAKLCDVYPDGRSMLVTDGALRAACRESFSSPSPLEPGKAYEFNIAVGSTSIIFNKGHRIRVAISSSNYPRFAAHPNIWGEGKPQVAKQTIYMGGDHASAVTLPVVTGGN